MKQFYKTFFRYFILLASVFMLILLGVVTGSVISFINDAKDLDIDNLKMNFTTIIYGVDPETGAEYEMDRLYDKENRIWIDYSRIPKHLGDAVVAIEDERFYKHSGFDIKRIAGAVLSFISKGKPSYGASTITQQLVKNITGDNEATIKRKIQEIYRAFKIEQELSKEQILELYLNTIFLSHQCNGVQSAANLYFGKDASELTLAEAASIAGITQYPSKYDPLLNPEENKAKQELVLGKMLELGYISQEEHDAAVAEELKFNSDFSDNESVTESHSYFVDTVIDEVLSDLQNEKGYAKQIALKMLYSGGLKIYASVDMNIQNVIEEVYRDSRNFPKFSGSVQPESAMVVLDPYTGYIMGIAGGRGEKDARRTLNRATHTLRQPGSTIKPIAVYAPAIEYGHISPSTVVIDAPITISGWTPRNSGGGYSGAVSVRTAVARSLNIPAVKILDKITIDTSFNFLSKNLGITSLVDSQKRADNKVYSDKNLSALALGGLTDGVSVLEMAAAYAAFANRGLYLKPSAYTRVLDYKGNVILEGSSEPVIAMSEQTGFLITRLLEGVVQSGTGRAAALPSMPAAGKTGTTSDDRDRWFIGYTPYYVGAVWFGYDQPKPLSAASGNPAITIWKNVMSRIHAGKEIRRFEEPAGITTVSICELSGKRATSLCGLDIRGSYVRAESFKDEQVPSDYCTAHQSYTICTESNLLAGPDCPPEACKTVSALGTYTGEENEKSGYISSEVCRHQAQPAAAEAAEIADKAPAPSPTARIQETAAGE